MKQLDDIKILNCDAKLRDENLEKAENNYESKAQQGKSKRERKKLSEKQTFLIQISSSNSKPTSVAHQRLTCFVSVNALNKLLLGEQRTEKFSLIIFVAISWAFLHTHLYAWMISYLKSKQQMLWNLSLHSFEMEKGRLRDTTLSRQVKLVIPRKIIINAKCHRVSSKIKINYANSRDISKATRIGTQLESFTKAEMFRLQNNLKIAPEAQY